MDWLLDGMIFLGSALMVYNIYSYVRYAKNLQKKEDWGKERNILYIPIVLLVLFLLGYLAVGLFGKPDLVISGILFGGSIFVFLIFYLLQFITARVQKNEHLEAKLAAAEETGREKNRFLSNVSHEMRTPMNGIIGLDFIALKRPDLHPETRRQLVKIGENAEYLKTLINNILDMSDIDSGKIVLKQDTFSLKDLLEEINLMLRSQCSRKGLYYSYSVKGELNDFYVGDKGKVRQVLLSILGNALKFTPAPGDIFFETEQIETNIYNSTLRFTITDTGIGMDPEYIPKIFNVFSRENDSNTDTYGGIGLGLTLTKKFVKLMNGDIDVASKKGEGSTFTVTIVLGSSDRKAEPKDINAEINIIPELESGDGTAEQTAETDEAIKSVPDRMDSNAFVSAAASQDEPVPSELKSEPFEKDVNVSDRTQSEGVRVLIAEDIDLNAEILADLLEMEDIASDRAENGQESVRMFSESPENYYDAILMDLRMPVMDGVDAARNIRKLDRPDASTIPIIALTANASYDDRQNVIRAGMNSHLTKPIDSELLYETLSKLIRKKQETV
ncbi:MAG: response regulator [Anaerolineaceae bacterium]|nr:response regulator [Anaerolineaceae bacterium]